MGMHKILLDGKYFATGEIKSICAMELETNPLFDVTRLSYAPESLILRARDRVATFAEEARTEAIGETGAGHREALLTKGVLAVLTIARTNTKLFDSDVAPAITAAFEAEAERREKGETADDLMVASAKKMLASLMVHGLVEGRVKSLSDKIEATPVDELDELLATNQVEARAELNEILGGSSIA